MTRAARIVLQDAKHALAHHTNQLQSEAFRTSWFTVVGLLRAVGHVLAKVDVEQSTAMRRAIEEKWQALLETRPEPIIFWGFIDSERNRFLKNYEHAVSRKLIIPTLRPGYVLVSERTTARGSEMNPGTELDSRITSGPFIGQNERSVAWQAHDWWERYLFEVDELAASYHANQSSSRT